MTAAVIVVGVVAWIGCGYVGAHTFPVQFPTLSKYADGSPSAGAYAVSILNGPMSLIFGWPDWIDGFRQRFFDESEDEADADNYTKAPAIFGSKTVTTSSGRKVQVPTLKKSAATFAATGTMPSSSSADLSDVEPRESSDPLVGFRQWRLFEMEDGQIALVSSIRPYVYDGPVATTEREDLENGYGLHAAKNGDKFYDPAAHLPVEGEVELFGRAVEGSRGYRAEKLKIKSLTLYPGGWREAEFPGKPSFPTFPGLANQRVPSEAVRQFASSELAETPWPHPFKSLASRLEDRYRCDVEIGERDGSPILDKSRSNGRPQQTNYHFIQKPTDSEVAEYSTGGELWTPREPKSDGEITIDDLEEAKKKIMKQARQFGGGQIIPTGTVFNLGGQP